MLDFENKGIDPMDPKYIEQEILFSTNHWFISNNRFPYEGVDKQFLIVSKNLIYKIEDISLEMWEDLQKIWLYLKDKI